MRTINACILAICICIGGCTSVNHNTHNSAADPPYWGKPESQAAKGGVEQGTESQEMESETVPHLADPIEPVNRAFFQFNDKLYFWVLKPAARAYNFVVPERGRIWVRNFFSNVLTPVRLVNCLLQAKFSGAGTELERFGINTTVGVLGFGDPAYHRWNIVKRREDLGQTLAVWGLGPAFYIDWPVLGPSTLRDTAGYAGDIFLDPANYVVTPLLADLGVKAYEYVNDVSLNLGTYESFKEESIDPYSALRSAYWQHRIHLINDKE